MYKIPSTLSDDIKQYSLYLEDYKAGKIEPLKFRAIRVPMGIYEQRKDGTYMIRIRCAGGFITPIQLKKAGEIAMKYHYDQFHLTTRQEMQLLNVSLDDTPYILHNLKEIGLVTKGGGGNTVRNIMASVDSGISGDEVFDVLPYAIHLTSKLIAEPDSYTLPRKFKIAFSNSEKDNAFAIFNDLGFIARMKGNQRGFRVYIGGSLGVKPMIGYELFDFLPEEDIFYVVDAAKKLFSRYGNRKNKHQARLRYLFYKLGKEKVFQLFFEIFNEIKTIDSLKYKHEELVFPPRAIDLISESAEDEEAFIQWKERFVFKQKQQGLFSIIIPVEHGNISAEQLIALGDFLSLFGEDVLRFSMRQNIHLRNIPSEYLGNVFNFLRKAGINTNAPFFLQNIITCTGADTCRLGICLSRNAGKALRNMLSKTDLPMDALKDIVINISGCPNSCGQHPAADLGFYGKVGRNDRMFPAYNIVAGARRNASAPKLAELVGEISARDLPAFTVDVLKAFVSKKDLYESFTDYIEKEGKQDIVRFCQKYNQHIPAFADDKNYYYDWGSDSVFSLVNKGIGECSAGLFDLIEADITAIRKAKEELETTSDPGTIDGLLYKIIYASARMLLITRGVEPKNEEEVFDAFIEKFIHSNLISSVYKEIIEIAKNNPHYHFREKKSTVFELSEAMFKLYESMDDSLQFQGDAYHSEKHSAHGLVHRKDLRGVSCPLNFVRTKIELSSLRSGDILEILLDDGEPIENVPASVANEGHRVLKQEKHEDYWLVTIQKG